MVFRWLIEWEGGCGEKIWPFIWKCKPGEQAPPATWYTTMLLPLNSHIFIITNYCLKLSFLKMLFFYFKGKTLPRVGNYVTDLYIRDFFENSLVRPTLVYINYNLWTFSTLSHYVGYHFGLWSSELVFCNMNHTNWTNNFIIFSQYTSFKYPCWLLMEI